MSGRGDPAAEVAAWNKANPVGILVEVTKDHAVSMLTWVEPKIVSE